MKNYEELTNKLDKIMKGYSGIKLESPITKEEFSQLISYDLTEDWNNTTAWNKNEYGTQDFKLNIETIDDNQEVTDIRLALEVNNDLITHINKLD